MNKRMTVVLLLLTLTAYCGGLGYCQDDNSSQGTKSSSNGESAQNGETSQSSDTGQQQGGEPGHISNETPQTAPTPQWVPQPRPTQRGNDGGGVRGEFRLERKIATA
jgi:hypothetical protein